VPVDAERHALEEMAFATASCMLGDDDPVAVVDYEAIAELGADLNLHAREDAIQGRYALRAGGVASARKTVG
jgi:hypothetical protein